jgi:hypothetical protein
METNLENKINEQLWRLEGHKEMASFIFNQICMSDYSIRNMQESREKAVYVVQELIVKKYEDRDAIGWTYWNSVKEELYKL